MRHEKSWYVLQVLTGMEQASAERLRQADMRAEAPVMVLQERRHGKWWPVRRTVFPGYVFVYTEMRDRTYYHIKQLPGMIRWLGVSGPETVPEEQMKIIGLFANGGLDFGVYQGEKRGDRTAVTSGPLSKLEGQIVKVNARARRATVQVPLLDTTYQVDVGIVAAIRELINPEGIVDGRIIAAQRSFYEYCKLMGPKFFRDDRPYQRELCDTLQAIFEGTLVNKTTGEPFKNLMINLPPRHGKSYTLTLFVQWCMGRRNETRVISVSYNDILAGRFARNVRDGIDADKLDSSMTVFRDVFPSTRVKQGDAAAQLWSLEGQFFNYLATGFGGTITGIGCSMGIIDDPIKNDQEAFNDRVLEEQWSWYTDTFLSRIEEGGMQIIVMTRWSTKDLCGKLLGSEDGGDWYVFRRPACIDEAQGLMLCPSLLSFRSYQKKRRLTSAEIADANYQQEPVDIKGKLYGEFRTYTVLPRDEAGKLDFSEIISYTDTADTGADDLVSLVAGVHEGEGYILDVLMTDEPMEKTEPQTAEQLYGYHVETARIESNNGGRGFARNVERLLWELYQTRSVNVEWFHQGANKQARILSGATFVMQHLLFPEDWAARWPRYHAAMASYQRAGKNKHDDAPDATTGLAETIQEREGKGTLDIWWV